MTSIGFIGLGIMGAPMAAHLADAGHQVAGLHAGTAATRGSSAAAAAPWTSPTPRPGRRGRDHHAAQPSPRSRRSCSARTACSPPPAPGALLIDMCTIRPESSIAIAEAGAEAPDPGAGRAGLGRPGAAPKKASLSIMVGGSEADFAAATDLRAVGKTIVHVGPHGAGQTVKAANQLVVGGTYALVAEAIVLLEAPGVDARAGLDVLAGGLAASRILDLKRESMLAREFTPGFRIDLHHKDMGIVTDAARTGRRRAAGHRPDRPADRRARAPWASVRWTTPHCSRSSRSSTVAARSDAMTPRIVCAADKFKGSLTAVEVAERVTAGLRRVVPDLRVDTLPVADGGDGTVAAAVAAGFERREARVTGPLGTPVTAAYRGARRRGRGRDGGGLRAPAPSRRRLRAADRDHVRRRASCCCAALDAGARTIVLRRRRQRHDRRRRRHARRARRPLPGRRGRARRPRRRRA